MTIPITIDIDSRSIMDALAQLICQGQNMHPVSREGSRRGVFYFRAEYAFAIPVCFRFSSEVISLLTH
jgi:hypothetical protein